MQSRRIVPAANGSLRYARPEEAPLIIALLRRQYGSSYKREFYDSAWLARRMEEGSLSFFFAIDSGAAAGVIGRDTGSVFPSGGRRAGALQYILLIVDAAYRGKGIGKALFGALLESTRLENYSCVYGYCVTFDMVSQRFHADTNFKMTGMLLNRYFFDAGAPNVASAMEAPPLHIPVKRSNLILCLPGTKKDAGLLYAPEKLRPYIARVYGELGASFRFAESGGSGGAAGDYKVDNDRGQRYCELYVWKGGGDFAGVLEKTLRENSEADYTFNAFINMNDAASPEAFEILEDNKFFFTGLQTLSGKNEYIVAHRSRSLAVSFEAMQAHPAYAGRVSEIKEYYERRN